MKVAKCAALVLGPVVICLGSTIPAEPIDPQAARPAPVIDRPVMFNTPEADQILTDQQIYPPDNPWNQDVSAWPVHPHSQEIIASIGADKPLRHNRDMGFVLVPPNQQRDTGQDCCLSR